MLIIPVVVQSITYAYMNSDTRTVLAYSEVDLWHAEQIAKHYPGVIVMID